jgi:hypothetical protein
MVRAQNRRIRLRSSRALRERVKYGRDRSVSAFGRGLSV